ncbi:Acid phosphatase [Aphelenchoides bicaudatus]|nr:Acid phosphatase [Aphelenchoides bicaudatus]
MEAQILRLIYCFAVFASCFGFEFGDPIPPNTFDTTGTLVFLQTVWRHGDRTPTGTFPGDPNKWNRALGELTPRGMNQHFILGERLNQRYVQHIKFLPESYDSTKVYVRSTDVNRTILSAVSNLIGFYKGKPNDDYPNITGWPTNYVPIPIHTAYIDYNDDHVGNPLSRCDRATSIMALIKETPEVQKTAKDSQPLLNKLTELAEEKIDLWNVWSVYDAWFIDLDNNKTLPPSFTEQIYNETRDLNNVVDNYDYGIGIAPYKEFKVREELTKVRGGPILWSLINHINDKIYCTTTDEKKWDKKKVGTCKWIKQLQWYAYSAHDITIAGLFAAFGFNETNFDEPGFPHYSAAVSVELWKDTNAEFYVKIYYWKPPANLTKPATDGDIFDLTSKISGCNDKCALSAFVKRSELFKVDDINKLCDEKDLFSTSFASTSTTLSFALFFSLIVYYVFKN